MSQLSASDWDHWFPNQRGAPDPGVFEIGLVLARPRIRMWDRPRAYRVLAGARNGRFGST